MTTTYDMVLWMENNRATLVDLVNPLIEQREKALSSYDNIFHDDSRSWTSSPDCLDSFFQF